MIRIVDLIAPMSPAEEPPAPAPTAHSLFLNREIAHRFDEVAALLEQQGANAYRVQAYRAGAATLRRLDTDVTTILEREGITGLEHLPTIGPALARAIRDVVQTGRLPLLDRLSGETDPIAVLRSVPGIGERTATRLHRDLGLETLEDLEMAAHDGRLAGIPGLGPKRIAGIRDCLAARLGRLRLPVVVEPENEPPVSELLDVDREYRELAHQGALPRIAPRRFNPTHQPWLPVLHTTRHHRHYTALFSNTARAHRSHKTGDWVVIYYDGDGREQRATVITAQRGPLAGRRIVRGREDECDQHYHYPSGRRAVTAASDRGR